jgi:hypothetical protein
MGENLKVVRAEFSTLSLVVLLNRDEMHIMSLATSRVETSAQVLSC